MMSAASADRPVTLPPAQLLSVDVLNVVTYDERAGLLNPFRAEDRDVISRRVRSQLMAAARLGRPVIDADMMGRAYPEAQMTSVSVGGLTPYPLSAVDCRGLESVVQKVPTWKWMERVSRKICVEYGSIASTCKAPRTGAEVKKWGIHGTTTKAIAIGAAVREAQRTPGFALNRMSAWFGGGAESARQQNDPPVCCDEPEARLSRPSPS